MCNSWFGIWYYFWGQIWDVGGSMKSSLSSPSSHECLSLKKKKKVRRCVCCLIKHTRGNAHLMDFPSLHGGGK